jgi:hypothetical protein
MRISKVMTALTLVVFAAGCGSNNDTTSPNASLKIAIVSGSGQTQTVSKVLTNSLVAKVTNAANQPVSGKTVNWTVTAGGGTLGSATSVTNAEGLATNTLTVGPTETTNTVTATIADQPSASVAFTAAALWEQFEATMTGAKETPALTNTATATALYKLISPSSMSYQVTGSGLTGTWTGLHIHATCCDVAGKAGVIVNLCPTSAACSISGTGAFQTSNTFTATDIVTTWAPALTAQQRFDSLLVLMRKGDGTAYTNIHTSVNTGGQARGEIATKVVP